MIDERTLLTIKRNSDVIEIQAQILEQAAKGVLDAIKERRSLARVRGNMVNMKKALDKIKEEFAEIVHVIE